MNNTRNLAYVFGAILIFSIAVANLAMTTSTNVKADSRPEAGMGDVRHLEGQQSRTSYETADSSHKQAGFGDLQRFDAQHLRISGVQATSGSTKGIGDLHLFENQSSATFQANPGMGDIQHFEAIR